MLKHPIIFLCVAVLFIWFQFGAGGNPSYWFFVLPVAFLFLFYFLIVDDRISFGATIALFLFSVAFGTFQKKGFSYVFLPLAGSAVSLGAFGVVWLYFRNWGQKIRAIETRKANTEEETKVLKARFKEREESLHHLEHQVAGLVHLFEMARNFNECLAFQELLLVLEQKIVPELSFKRGTMILVEPLDESERRISQALSFGREKRQDEEANAAFAKECLGFLTSLNQVLKIESADVPEKDRLLAHQVQYPFWLFPLAAEHQLIAVLAVEGGAISDFPKFEILASQLMLQVKKIQLYERVREISIVDGLTQTFVRRHFLERFHEELARAIRYQFPLSVLMVDVDHFKRYNDQFGHLIGDRTLREVAQVIRENIRKVDVLGRYGGEEFIVVAPEIGKQQGLELAERIRSAVARRRLRFYGEETQITVSIGTSSFPQDLGREVITEFSEHYIQNLIYRSDQALYRAKEEGRNRVVAFGES